MKKILLSIVALSAFLYADAQGYYYFKDSTGTNPGNLNQDDTEFPSGAGGLAPGWATVLAGGNTAPAISNSQTIPFAFDFNGGAVTTYKAISNGSISFANSAVAPASYSAPALPSATVADSSVNILGIGGTGANDNIMSKTFGTAPNRQHWIFFTSHTSGANWTYWSIVLEETTNKIYIVDQRHSATITGLSMGIQINSTTAIAVSNTTSLAGGNSTAEDNIYYEFFPGVQPSYDMAAKRITTDPIVVLSSAPFTITGKIQNRGSVAVTNYDLNYKIGTGSAVTASISGANIANGAVGSFSHPTLWTPSAVGTYTIEAWATNINGNPDANTADDKVTFSIDVVDTIIPRKTLMEVFTSSTCGPCVAGNQNMDNTVVPSLTAGTYTIIKYQQNFPAPGDPYQTAKSVARRNFYGVNSIPRMEIDGQWDVNASSLTKSIVESFQSKPSFINIDITSARIAGPVVAINADITPYANLAGNLKYHVVITEKETFNNTGSNGETEFFEVMMDMLPNETGNNLTSLNSGVATNVRLESGISLDNIEETGDLRVVVFVQDMTSKEILQSEWMDISLSSVGVIENENNILLDIFPNPSNGMITLNYTSTGNIEMTVSVVNMIGEVVYTENAGNGTGNFTKNLDLSSLSKGVYMVNINSELGITTKKLVIQ